MQKPAHFAETDCHQKDKGTQNLIIAKFLYPLRQADGAPITDRCLDPSAGAQVLHCHTRMLVYTATGKKNNGLGITQAVIKGTRCNCALVGHSPVRFCAEEIIPTLHQMVPTRDHHQKTRKMYPHTGRCRRTGDLSPDCRGTMPNV